MAEDATKVDQCSNSACWKILVDYTNILLQFTFMYFH